MTFLATGLPAGLARGGPPVPWVRTRVAAGRRGLAGFALIGAGLAILRATDAASFGQTREQTPEIIPWLEVNEPLASVAKFFPDAERSREKMTMRDYALEGVQLWAGVSKTVIISTGPGQVQWLYPYLMRGKPETVRIIGGLKTLSLPGVADERRYDFADPAGWAEIAEAAVEVARLTGANEVLLENETALTRFTAGEAGIDAERLKVALEPLRQTGLVFWWNLPRILPNTPSFPDRRERTKELVLAIREVLPRAVFLGGYTAWHDWTREAELRLAMIDLVGLDRLQERLLVTPSGLMDYPDGRQKRCFTPAEAVARLSEFPGRRINVYPGGAFWVSAARGFLDAYDGKTSAGESLPGRE